MRAAPAKQHRTRSRAFARRWPRRSARRSSSPIRMPSLGSSTFAAPLSITRRCRYPTPECRRKVHPRSITMGASSPKSFATRSAISSTLPRQRCWVRWPGSVPARHAYISTLPRRRQSSQALEAAGGKADIGTDPIALMKAVKNGIELDGGRRARIIAMPPPSPVFSPGSMRRRQRANSPRSSPRKHSRPSAAIQGRCGTCRFRRSPALANAAIPHYRVSRTSNRKIEPGIFLVDSGAQYEDGTTDITRTIAVGPPTAEMRDRFTRVLKGHIAIARVRLPARAPPARRSTPSLAPCSGPPASTTTTAPAMAWAAISASTKTRSSISKAPNSVAARSRG